MMRQDNLLRVGQRVYGHHRLAAQPAGLSEPGPRDKAHSVAQDFGAEFIPIKIALEDGILKMGIGDTGEQPMIPLSEVAFTGFGAYIEFGKGDQGNGDHLVVRLAEGDYRANKK